MDANDTVVVDGKEYSKIDCVCESYLGKRIHERDASGSQLMPFFFVYDPKLNSLLGPSECKRVLVRGRYYTACWTV